MEFKGFVIGVVGNDEDVVLVGSGLDALDERPLVGIEDIDFVPLEEDVFHRNFLASYDVTAIIFRIHAASSNADQELGTLECGDDEAFTFVFEYGLLASECARHGADRYKWDSFGWRCSRFYFGIRRNNVGLWLFIRSKH